MTTTPLSGTVDLDPDRNVPGLRRPGFADTFRGEWIKFWTVRSTVWATVALVVVGAGMTAVVCATSAAWLGSADADEPVAAFITWGMLFAQMGAILLGAVAVTGEYSTGTIRATLTATPRRGVVLAGKCAVLTVVLSLAGTITAFAGYFAGNWFLAREGIGVALGDDGVLRAMFGNGLYLAGLGLLAASVGLLVRHTAAALCVVLAVVFLIGNLVFLLPGAWGEWLGKLMPGNAGSVIATAVSFNPDQLTPWVGFAVFCAELAAVLVAGYLVLRRRDA